MGGLHLVAPPAHAGSSTGGRGSLMDKLRRAGVIKMFGSNNVDEIIAMDTSRLQEACQVRLPP